MNNVAIIPWGIPRGDCVIKHKGLLASPLIFSILLLLVGTGCSTLAVQSEAGKPSKDGEGLSSALRQSEHLGPKVDHAVGAHSYDTGVNPKNTQLGQPTGWAKPILVSSSATAPWSIERQFSFGTPGGSSRVSDAGGAVFRVSPLGDSQHHRLNFNSAQAESSGILRLAQVSPGAKSGGIPQNPSEIDLAKLAQKTNNPISDVFLLIMQNDTTLIGGDLIPDTEVINVTKLMPVLPVPIFGGAWNLVVRPVLQIVSVPLKDEVGSLIGISPNNIVSNPGLAALAGDPFGRTTGLGDSVLLTLVGPNTDDGWIFAGGASQIFPTATEDILGQGKWQAGPAFLVVRLGKDYGGLGIENWNVGALGQQWWSYAGEDNRRETSQADIQYFINWKATPTQLIGMTPNISIDWTADGPDKVSFPIGLGTIGLFKIGPLPIRWGVEAQYYVTQPDAVAREWNFRVFIAPIMPNLFK